MDYGATICIYSIYNTTGFGPRKIKKKRGVQHFLVYMQTVKYAATHTPPRGRTAHPWGGRRRALCVCFAAYLNSLHIHQEMVYTSPFLIFSRPKPGGGVYIYMVFPQELGERMTDEELQEIPTRTC